MVITNLNVNIEKIKSPTRQSAGDSFDNIPTYYIASFNYTLSENKFFFRKQTYNKTIYLPMLFKDEEVLKCIIENYDNLYVKVKYDLYSYSQQYEYFHISKLLDEKFYNNHFNFANVKHYFVKKGYQLCYIQPSFVLKINDIYVDIVTEYDSFIRKIFTDPEIRDKIIFGKNLTDKYNVYRHTLVCGDESINIDEFYCLQFSLDNFSTEMRMIIRQNANKIIKSLHDFYNNSNSSSDNRDLKYFGKDSFENIQNDIDFIYKTCNEFSNKIENAKERKTYKLVKI